MVTQEETDSTDAAWHQQELTEQEFFEHHRHVYDNFQHWLKQEGFAHMKTSELIESKFLKKSDFPDDQICTIRGIKQQNVGNDDKPEMKWALYLTEHQKPMILNTTSIKVLDQAFGDETDNWRGKKVTVYVDPNVSFQGQVVGGLRLRPIKDKAAAPAKAVAPAPAAEDFNDDVPF